jgi:hypothetical protein
MSKTTIQVAARGTNNHHTRRRAGMVFKTELQDVELDLGSMAGLKAFIELKEDGHLIVAGGPKLEDAKAELAKLQKAEQLAAGAKTQPATSVDFTSRDEVAKALKDRDDRAAFLQAKADELAQDNQDLQESLTDVLARLAKLEASAAPAAPAEQPKQGGQGQQQGGGKK